MSGLGWEQWGKLPHSASDLPEGWGWKVTRPSGRGFDGDDVDYAAALRDGRVIPLEQRPGTPLRQRTHPWHKAAPFCSGGPYLPPVPALPFGLWIVTIVPGDADERGNRTWHQKIHRKVPAWWALGPHGRTAAAVVHRLGQATWQDVLALRRSYDKAWPVDATDPAWYEAQDLARKEDRAVLKDALIRHTETALSQTARAHGKKIRDFSNEQKSACFSAVALAISDIDPGLAHRLLGPIRIALGDVYGYPVPTWADT